MKKNVQTKDKEKKDSLLGRRFRKCNQGKVSFSLGKSYRTSIFSKIRRQNQYFRQQNVWFPNPIYEALALNISYLNRIPRQLSPENRNIYRYYLSDTIEIDNRKTYVIKFKEITNKLNKILENTMVKFTLMQKIMFKKKLETNSKNKTKEGEPSFGNLLTINGFGF